jgi:hypothetical protein
LGNNFQSGKFTLSEVFNGEPVVLYNVPADRCNQCGFDIISAEVGRRIEEALTSVPNKYVTVASHDLDIHVRRSEKKHSA